MITEILQFSTSNKVEEIYIEKYNRIENVILNIHLHDKNVNDYIDKLKNV